MLSTTPKKSVLVTTYDELERIVASFMNGRLPFLLLIGPPGTGKSEMVRRLANGRDVFTFQNHATALALYQQLYVHRDELVVVDDLDGIHQRKSDIRLLKCLCDSTDVKRLAWYSNHQAIGDGPDQTPCSYETTSPVCIVANEWRTIDENVRALESRATLTVLFNPSAWEVHRMVAGWFDDHAVLKFVGMCLDGINEPDIRHYVSGKKLRESGNPKWKEYLAQRLGLSEDLRVFNEIRMSAGGQSVPVRGG